MKCIATLAALALGVGVFSFFGAMIGGSDQLGGDLVYLGLIDGTGNTETFTDTRELQTRQFYNLYEE